jgi:hypothetical protein
MPGIMWAVSELPSHDAAKAIAHPLRAAALERLCEREASPVDLAKETKGSLANVRTSVNNFSVNNL